MTRDDFKAVEAALASGRANTDDLTQIETANGERVLSISEWLGTGPQGAALYHV